jgi:hypothetical protein
MTPSSLSYIAQQNFNHFKQLEGSKHIATFSSQLNLLEVILKFDIKNALDWGAGIGTITKLLILSKDCDVTAYESNAWCRDQFKKNLELNERIELSNKFPLDPKYDLIVIDDDISRKQIRQLLKEGKTKVIFIEGWRNKTVGHVSLALLLNRFPAQFKRCASRLEEFDLYSKKGTRIEKSGSYFIVFAEKKHIWLSLLSWVKRLKKTNEFRELFKELYFWVSRVLAVRSRIKKLSRQ